MAPIILNDSTDWDLWLRQTKSTLDAYNLLQYTIYSENPSPSPEPQRPEPFTPVFSSENKTEQQKRDDKDQIDLQFKIYSLQNSTFDRFDSRKLQAYGEIRKTCGEIAQNLIIGKPTINSKIKALEANFAPSDQLRDHLLTTALDRLRKGPKNQNILKWANDWHVLYERLDAAKHPDAHRITNYFIIAAGETDTAIQGMLFNLRSTMELQEKTLTLTYLTSQYVRYVRDMQTTPRTSCASLQGNNMNGETIVHSSFGQGNSNQSNSKGSNLQNPRRPCGDLTGKPESKQCKSRAACPIINPKYRPVSDKRSKEDKQQLKHYLNVLRTNPQARRTAERFNDKEMLNQLSNDDSKPANQEQFASAYSNSAIDKLNAISSAPQSFSATSSLEEGWILDTGSDCHIVNHYLRANFTPEREPIINTMNVGNLSIDIVAYGTCTLRLDTVNGGILNLTLRNVAYVPNFHVNVISEGLLTNAGFYFSSKDGLIRYNDAPLLQTWRPRGRIPHLKTFTPCQNRSQIFRWPKTASGQLLPVENALQNYHTSIVAMQEPQISEELATSFATARKSTHPVRKLPSKAWHMLLGHASRERVEALQENTEGAIVLASTEKVPRTNECDVCARSKSSLNNNRHATAHIPAPFGEVAVDVIQFEPAYNGDQMLFHSYDLETGIHFATTFPANNKLNWAKIWNELKAFVAALGRHIHVVRMDNEPKAGLRFRSLVLHNGTGIKTTAPYTSSQDPAERAGGVILTVARALRINGNLPSNLWPEIVAAAVYLINRTPTERFAWKTPFEMATGRKPNIAHIRLLGCKAYIHRTGPDAPLKIQKLEPRATIGFLVGWDSTTIARIWVPGQDKVIRTRNVLFDERQRYHTAQLIDHVAVEDVQAHALEPAHPDQYYELLVAAGAYDSAPTTTQIPKWWEPNHNPQKLLLDGPWSDTTCPSDWNNSGDYETTFPPNSVPPAPQQVVDSLQLRPIHTNPATWKHLAPESSEQVSQLEPQPQHQRFGMETSSVLENPNESLSSISFMDTDKPANKRMFSSDSPDLSPHPKRHESDVTPLNLSARCFHPILAFAVTSALAASVVTQSMLHHSQLSPEPRNYKQVLLHKLKDLWLVAMQTEFTKALETGTFVWCERPPNVTLIPLTWVFRYKLNADLFLTRCKARLCARGDLQSTEYDTYASTLAMRVFRALMAIIAAFDLECHQFDVVNAFLNASLPYSLYAYPPQGIRNGNSVLRICQALYGLKEAPLLWQIRFTGILKKLGLRQVPGVECLFTDGTMYIFFYVDDFCTVFFRKDKSHALKVEARLCDEIQLTGGHDIHWFLGMKITRNRANRTMWIDQEGYIEKMATQFAINLPATLPRCPLPANLDLTTPKGHIATKAEIKAFQTRIGSINFAAIATRLDISFAASTLSRFLTNPTKSHLKAADHVLQYLLATKTTALRYGHGQPSTATLHAPPPRREFFGASDASFGDDSVTRKSSEGWIFSLFGGPVDWKAARQTTVTKSTTEAELLSLSRAGTEMVWWNRLFENLNLRLDTPPTLQCDNQQTLGIVTKDLPKLKTTLRHVDIHHHWLRQAHQDGSIEFEWVPTSAMAADGLTKALGGQAHCAFISRAGLATVGVEFSTKRSTQLGG